MFFDILKDSSDGDIKFKTILSVKPNYLLKVKNEKNKYLKILLLGDSCFEILNLRFAIQRFLNERG